MNKNRFRSDMEAAWELRPQTDGTPESRSHTHRFAAPSEARKKENAQNGAKGKTRSDPETPS